LGTLATVFQAEVLAVLYCGLELLSGLRQEDTINICSDSRAAIMVISAKVVHSKLVLEYKTTLEKLAQKNDIRLVWVPGHADRLAKLGTQIVPVGPEPTVGIANSRVIQSLKSLALQLFQDSAIGMRQERTHQ